MSWDKIAGDIINEYGLKVASWKDKEIKDLIVQLIKSGDIIQFTIQGQWDKYSVQYIPFAGVENLKKENAKLREALEYYADDRDWACVHPNASRAKEALEKLK